VTPVGSDPAQKDAHFVHSRGAKPSAGGDRFVADVQRFSHRSADGHISDAAAAPAATGDRRPIRQQRGEGIGLSIVKRLCELLDASLELESKVGEGTTFRVLFPRRYESASAPPPGR